MKKSSQPTTRTILARAKSLTPTVANAAPVMIHVTHKTSVCRLSDIFALSLLIVDKKRARECRRNETHRTSDCSATQFEARVGRTGLTHSSAICARSSYKEDGAM
jgi:hypothetical protein